MKKVLLALSMFFVGLTFAQGVTPNSVKTTTRMNYDASGGTPTYNEKTSIAYTDGLGRKLQSQIKINGSTDKKIVSGVSFDEFGRVTKSFLPFVESGTFQYIPLSEFEAKANAYYHTIFQNIPETDQYAFSETEFWGDPLNRVKQAGSPGLEYSLHGNHYPNGNSFIPRQWTFGTKSNSLYFLLTSDGFIDFCQEQIFIDIAMLDKWFDERRNMALNPDMFLTVSMDPNGIISQTISDISGNVIKIAEPFNYLARPDAIRLLSKSEFDINGNLLKQYASEYIEGALAPSSFIYNTLGQKIKQSTPDEGTVRFKYNSIGQLRFAQNAKQESIWQMGGGLNKPVLLYEFDKFGQPIIIAILDLKDAIQIDEFDDEDFDGDLDIEEFKNSTTYRIKIRTIYDDIKGNEICFENSSIFPILSTIDFANTKGQVVAKICYGEYYSEIENPQDKVIELFNYNEDGKIKTRFKSIPDLELQIITYHYNLVTGALLSKEYNNGENVVITKYVKDSNGRLQETRNSDNKKIISYIYNDLDQILKKSYWNTHSPPSAHNYDIEYSYNIRNWIKSINYDPAEFPYFHEELFYADAPGDGSDYPENKRQYNGNIGFHTIIQTTNTYENLRLLYTYDEFGRLTEVKNGENIKDDYFDAEYEYDKISRLKKKNEGYNEDGTPLNKKEDYSYQFNKNSLKHIPNSDQEQTAEGNDNYLYDPNGNMVLDRSKNMAIVYDWRDMPITFKFHDFIPDEEIAWFDAANIEDVTSSEPLPSEVSRVEMAYDASGTRVFKKVFRQ